jgi:hypothetical protein
MSKCKDNLYSYISKTAFNVFLPDLILKYNLNYLNLSVNTGTNHELHLTVRYRNIHEIDAPTYNKYF